MSRNPQRGKSTKINRMTKSELDAFIARLKGSHSASKVYQAATARRAQM